MTSQSPLQIWQEKLESLQRARAIESSASENFKLEHLIKECLENIEKFQTNPNSSPKDGATEKREPVQQPIKPSILEDPEEILPSDSSFYVERPDEKRGYEAILKLGALIRVKSPHKIGKTSYLVRLLAYAEKQDFRTVVLDLRPVNKKFFTDLDMFLQWFCTIISKKLEIETQIKDYWNDFLGSNDNCTEYFEKYIFKILQSPLVLAIDNFERVFENPTIEGDFCALLRSWHESAKRNKTNNPWEKLKLIVVYSQEPYVQRNINQSPFNVGVPVELTEFTESQVKDLIYLHGLNWNNTDVNKLMKMVGGHPYLIRLALYEIANNNTPLEQLLANAPTEAGLYSNHLLGHRKTLEDNPKLEQAIKTIIASNSPVRLNSEEAFKLDSMGLIVRENDNVKIRCDLYQLYFGHLWGVN